jgi:hypothetical protein
VPAVANPYAPNFKLALETQARFWPAIGVTTLVFFALYKLPFGFRSRGGEVEPRHPAQDIEVLPASIGA